MKLQIAELLYTMNIGLLILLVTCYLKNIRGVWPPSSKKTFFLGWAWYILIYVLAIWLYILELQTWTLTVDILLFIGLFMISSGILLMLWAFKAFKSVRRVLGSQVDTLIITGPYKYTRNPQYLATTLILLGLTIVHRSYLILGFTLLQALTYYLLALLEEKLLEEKFKRAYREYKQKVPRFIPIKR